ncbi:ATP-binding protein [Noviherbaspirillum sp. CPCC 100848]|uniref:histidine kinase n=1 Tax=Noviherbaspirillum album TaxID=3080276 RepID=A0ABU6JDY6_9BURK|nr:ATP-binding protein [Noviherbaspirillum sp. CPCC 100848]MEC4721638.1 ATP-binding protein [Noviherbaspirillum sp. CPCC 100848]
MRHTRNIPVEHFEFLFETSPGSFLVLLPDEEFRIVGVTNDYLRDTITQREDILGKAVFDAFPDNPNSPEANSTENLGTSLRRVVATKASDTMPIQRYDVPRRDGTGFELRYWSPVNTPVLSESGELLYIIHRVENVTDYVRLREESEARRKKSAELSAQNEKMEAEILQRGLDLDAKNRELRQVNETLLQYAQAAREEARMKDEFLAMLAHELRNPLAGISTALELLGIAANDSSKAKELREVCYRQLDNLTRLVDDLLDVSRVSRGAVSLRKEPLDLRDVLDSALHAVRGFLDERGLAVSTSINPGSYRMTGDATRLEQVLSNLLTNAAKYTETGGKVDIVVSNEPVGGESWGVLRMKDTGRGIPGDKLSKIFDMFVQVDTEIDRAQGGLGIGLTLVQKLVEMHGGTVDAYSEGIGCGSTFTVRLPLDVGVPLPAQRTRRGTLPLDMEQAAGARILLIEDNVDARETLKTLLQAYGYAVEVAETGEEGLRQLLKHRPDIAIVDIGLPGLDGFEVARRTRMAPEGSGVKLVALSGYSGTDTERKAVAAGFDLHLVKPVNPVELPKILAKYSSRSF